MFRSLALSAVVAIVCAPSARAADEPKDILAKAIKAHGGEEALTKHKASQTKNKGKINLPGVGEVEFTQETSFMIPDKLKDSMEIKVMGKSVNVLTIINGDKVTLEVDGTAIDAGDKVKDSMKEMTALLEASRLVPLKNKKYELSIIGEDKVGGKKVIGVRASAKNQKDVNLYFDKETWLLMKLEHRTPDPATGKEINEERIITEYGKSKSGVPQPKKVVIKHDGKQFLEAEVLEVKEFEKLDDSEFKK